MLLHLFAYLIIAIICGFLLLAVLAGFAIMAGIVLGIIGALVAAYRRLTGLDN